jgi:hypothetical protein
MPGTPAASCPACRYSLNGLSTRGTCPECGTQYDASGPTVLTAADKLALTPRCHHCLYNLAGLAPTGPCPECGQPYDVADGPPPTLADKAAQFPDRVAVGLLEARPWFWDRFGPSARNAAIITFVLGSCITLVWMGYEYMRAVYNKLGAIDGHGRIPSTPIAIGSAIGDVLLLLLHALPYLLVFVGLALARAGIQHRRVHIAPTVALEGADARNLGRFALYTALVIASTLFWMSLLS